MSLAIAIKNSVLLLLIILIIHFLIKNALIEQYEESFQATVVAERNATSSCNATASSESTATATATVTATDDEDLYKYVFGEPTDCAAAAELTRESNKGCGDESKKATKPPTISKCKTACDGSGDINGNLIVGSYADENGLNGGALFDGLLGYDGAHHSSFQEL